MLAVKVNSHENTQEITQQIYTVGHSPSLHLLLILLRLFCEFHDVSTDHYIHSLLLDTVAVSTAASTSSSLPPPPPGFSAKTTPTTAPAFPGTAVSTAGTVRAPGTQLNNTVNHSLWTGGVGGTVNLKGGWK